MSVYEASITNPKKQLEYYKDLSGQLLEENQKLRKLKTYFIDDTGEKLEYTLNDYMTILDINIQQNEQICELKKQLEEINKMIEKCGFANIEQVMLNYCGLLSQQKAFIKYLEDKVKYFKDLEQFAIKVFNNKAVINLDLVKISIDEDRIVIENLEEALQKYKEIIGGKE